MAIISQILRWLRRVGLWLVIGVSGLLVILVVGVVLYSRTAHFHQLLHAQILAALHDMFDAEVSFEATSGSVWQGLELRNLSIRKDGIEVVSLPRGVVSVDVFSQIMAALRTSSIQVANITLSEPVVHLVQDSQAGWNISRLVKQTEPPPPEQPAAPLPISVLLPRLVIENGRVSVRLADGREFQASAITLDGGLSLLPTGMQAEVRALQYALSGAGVPDAQWHSSVTFTDEGGVRNVTLQSIDLRTSASHLQLSGTVENLAEPKMELQLAINNLAASDVGLIAPPPRLRQDVSGNIRIAGLLSDLHVDTILKAADGHITSAVTANFSQSPPDVQGTVSVDQFAIHKVLVLPKVSGEVKTAQVKFHGTQLETLVAEMSAYVSQVEAAGKKIGDVNLSGAIVNGKASTFTEINNPAGYVYVQNQVTLGAPLAYESTIMVRNVNARPLTGDIKTPLTNVNADVWLKGVGVTVEELSSEAKLTIFPSRVGPTSISQGEFVASFREGQLTVKKGYLLSNDTTVDVRGQLGVLQKNTSGKISYNLAAKNITPWLALGGVDGKGAVNLTGAAEGALTTLRVDGKLTLANVEINGNEVRDGLIAYQFSDLGSQLPKGSVSLAANNVRVGMLLKAVNADVSFSGLQPAEVQADVTVQEREGRTHQLKTQARYTSEQVDVLIQKLALQLPTGTWSTPQTPRLTLRGSTLSINDLVLQHAEQRVSASGVVDPQGPLNFQLQIDRLALANLRPLIGEEPEVKGQVDATMKVLGTITNPDVTANLSTGPVTVAGQTYAGSSLQSTYRGERLELNLLVRQDDRHSLRVDGGLPLVLKPGASPVLGEVSFLVHSDGLSLAFLELFSREVKEVRGTVSMDVSVTGPVHALSPSGPIRLQQGNVYIKKLEQAFSDINVALQLEAQRLTLSEFSIRGGDGEFTGNGFIALKQYQLEDLDLTFDAKRFRVISTREYHAALSGQLRCSGSLEQPVISGDLSVVDTTLRPNIALLKGGPAAADPTITVVRTVEELSPPSPETAEEKEKRDKNSTIARDGFYEKLRLDVGVTIPRDTWVHMEEGSIELRGQVRARKAPHDELVMIGSVETVRGWVAVQGRKFQLERGAVTFSGGTPIDPDLDIIARYTLPDYLVDVVIDGTIASPTVAFKSDPALEQADILSLLVFGKPANALSDRQKTSLQSQAVQALVGTVATDLRQALAEQLGIENLELDVGDDPSQSKVGIGKYVAPGVFVSTSQQLGGGSGQGRDVTIEYQLNDNWQLKASSTARGNNEVDILWKKKY